MPRGISSTYTSEDRSRVMKKVWKRKSHRKKVAKGQSKAFATNEYHEKQSSAQVKRWTPSRRQKQSKALSSAWNENRKEWSNGIKAGNTKEVKTKKSNSHKKRLKDHNVGVLSRSKILHNKPMSNPEKQLKSILNLMELPYEFVGNGKLMVGRYCPDFVRVDAPAIIEVYSGYYHELESNKKHDKKRNAWIKRQGYSILIIKQKELDHLEKLVKKIKKFDERILANIISGNTQTPLSTIRVKVKV